MLPTFEKLAALILPLNQPVFVSVLFFLKNKKQKAELCTSKK